MIKSRMRSYRILFYACMAALLGLLLAHNTQTLQYMDLSLLKAVQRYASDFLDTLAIILAVVGAPFFSCFFILVLSLVFLARRKGKALLLFLALLVLLTGFEYISKVTVIHPRPDKEYVRHIAPLGWFRKIPDISVPGENSFPSGHCLRALYLMGILAMLLHRKGRTDKALLIAMAAAYCLAASWSRVYLGAHWPSDVVAGLVLGATGLLMYVKLQE